MANANLDFSGLSITRTFTFPDATGTIALTTGSSSIVTVGTITTGVWHGTKIGVAYGGTGADLSATGGASQVVMQVSSGANFTVAQLAASDLSNGTVGTGAVTLESVAATASPGFGVITAAGAASITPVGPVSITTYTPAGTIATFTLTLDDGTHPGQVLIVSSSHTITALTMAGTLTTQGLDQPTTLVANTPVGWVWDAADAGGTLGWMRYW